MEKENKCMLWKSTKKSNNYPDYKGNLIIDGKKFDVSAWENLTKDKRKYISLSFSLSSSISPSSKTFSTSTELKKEPKAYDSKKLSATPKTLNKLNTHPKTPRGPSEKIYGESDYTRKIDEGIAGNREDNKKMSGRQWARSKKDKDFNFEN